MSQKKGIKLVYSVCAIIIVACAIFFTLKYVIPKAHSGSEDTTLENFLISSVTQNDTETISDAVSSTEETATIPEETTSEKVTTSTTKETETTIASQTSAAPATYVSSTAFNVAKDFSCFDNCAFIGNSRVIALKNYGLVKNAYAVVGLTVDTIFTNSVAGSTIPVIDELWGKDYEKIFIMLGDNECGWSNKDIFINKYSKVIDAVKERVPNAEIYLQSILPVSKNASDTSPFGVTNDNINQMNVKIQQLATDCGVFYINPASALKDSDGALPDDAASDGIHLNKKYCKIWLTYIIENVFSGETE